MDEQAVGVGSCPYLHGNWGSPDAVSMPRRTNR